MVSIAEGYVYFGDSRPTNFSSNAVTTWSPSTLVKVHVEQVEIDFQNSLVEILKPITDSTDLPVTWVVNLNRVKKAFTISGFLKEEVSESKETKRDNLLGLGGYDTSHQGTCYMVFHTSSNGQIAEKVTLQKFKISEVAKEGVRKLPVKIVALVSEDKYEAK